MQSLTDISGQTYSKNYWSLLVGKLKTYSIKFFSLYELELNEITYFWSEIGQMATRLKSSYLIDISMRNYSFNPLAVKWHMRWVSRHGISQYLKSAKLKAKMVNMNLKIHSKRSILGYSKRCINHMCCSYLRYSYNPQIILCKIWKCSVLHTVSICYLL